MSTKIVNRFNIVINFLIPVVYVIKLLYFDQNKLRLNIIVYILTFGMSKAPFRFKLGIQPVQPTGFVKILLNIIIF